MTELRQRDPRREDAKHLAFIRAQPCCCCGSRRVVEAAHIRMACPAVGKDPTGMQEKPHDKWTVPLCRYHHQDGPIAQHKVGEEQFWRDQGRNQFAIAAALWVASGGAEREAMPKRAPRSVAVKARKPRERRMKIRSDPTIRSRGFDRRPTSNQTVTEGLADNA